MGIEEQIKQFIAQNLLFSENGFRYDPDASFLQEGIIDSLGVMELVTFVGQQFGVAVDPAEVTPDNFDSVNRLAAFVRRRQEEMAKRRDGEAALSDSPPRQLADSPSHSSTDSPVSRGGPASAAN